eukprot:TRINITY_DN15635_c0_g1_i1.p1 TRINITY_DN15635_c0_g1~~TRINITY_DN15635_c0_g1_i1.p1  ORF type:complete len:1220 (+),score=250.07 TRINITY_DN15635_c0_g1_i1:200-3661(+)
MRVWIHNDVDTATVNSGCLYNTNQNSVDKTGQWAVKGPTVGAQTVHVRVVANEDDGANVECDNDGSDDCKIDKKCSKTVTPGTSGTFTCSEGAHTATISYESVTPSPTSAPRAPSARPTAAPTSPTNAPVTPAPSAAPSSRPSDGPSVSPTAAPSTPPTVPQPSSSPVTAPPTANPTSEPTRAPTRRGPTAAPSAGPNAAPTSTPSAQPTSGPSQPPTTRPTAPSGAPTVPPSAQPSGPQPSAQPEVQPTAHPSAPPTAAPTETPQSPTDRPTRAPRTPGPSTPPVPPLAPPTGPPEVTGATQRPSEGAAVDRCAQHSSPALCADQGCGWEADEAACVQCAAAASAESCALAGCWWTGGCRSCRAPQLGGSTCARLRGCVWNSTACDSVWACSAQASAGECENAGCGWLGGTCRFCSSVPEERCEEAGCGELEGACTSCIGLGREACSAAGRCEWEGRCRRERRVIMSAPPEAADMIDGAIMVMVVGGAAPAATTISLLAGDDSCGQAPVTSLGIVLHPLQFKLDDSVYAGCVVGNMAIALAMVVLGLFTEFVVRPLVASKSRFENVTALLRYPGGMFTVMLFLYQGSTFCSAHILFHFRSVSPLTGSIGVAGMFGLMVGIPASIWFAVLKPLPRRAAYQLDAKGRKWLEFIVGPGEWVNVQDRWTDRFGSVVKQYRPPFAGQAVMMQMCETVAVSILRASDRENRAVCVGVNCALAAVFLLHGLYCWFREPYARRRDLVWELSTSVTVVLSTALSAAAIVVDDPEHWTVVVSMNLLLVAAVLLVIKVTLDVLTEMYVFVVKRRLRLQAAFTSGKWTFAPVGALKREISEDSSRRWSVDTKVCEGLCHGTDETLARWAETKVVPPAVVPPAPPKQPVPKVQEPHEEAEAEKRGIGSKTSTIGKLLGRKRSTMDKGLGKKRSTIDLTAAGRRVLFAIAGKSRPPANGVQANPLLSPITSASPAPSVPDHPPSPASLLKSEESEALVAPVSEVAPVRRVPTMSVRLRPLIPHQSSSRLLSPAAPTLPGVPSVLDPPPSPLALCAPSPGRVRTGPEPPKRTRALTTKATSLRRTPARSLVGLSPSASGTSLRGCRPPVAASGPLLALSSSRPTGLTLGGVEPVRTTLTGASFAGSSFAGLAPLATGGPVSPAPPEL